MDYFRAGFQSDSYNDYWLESFFQESLFLVFRKVHTETFDVFQDAIYKTKCEELDDVTNRRNEVRQGFEEVRKARLSEFMEGFHIISYKLKEMYQTITLGGDAEFELVDSLDPFVEGVSFRFDIRIAIVSS